MRRFRICYDNRIQRHHVCEWTKQTDDSEILLRLSVSTFFSRSEATRFIKDSIQDEKRFEYC